MIRFTEFFGWIIRKVLEMFNASIGEAEVLEFGGDGNGRNTLNQ